MSETLLPQKHAAERRRAAEHLFLLVIPEHQCGDQGVLWRSQTDGEGAMQKRPPRIPNEIRLKLWKLPTPEAAIVDTI